LNNQLKNRLATFHKNNQSAVLSGGLRGLEKESLRVASQGGIAQTPHPEVIGSALTHPWITTDYSEALTEFITPPMDNSEDVLCFLQGVQTFVYRRIDNESLWATSMPCILNGGKNIPLARYGNSNAGKMKTVYRRGLGYRYGRVMQVISGVHFNYSVPEAFWDVYYANEKSELTPRQFKDESYMGLTRNLQRFGWLIPYLMGASPAVCKSFFGDSDTDVGTDLAAFDDSTYYEPYATSLRMGDIGYQNSKEEGLGIKANYNSLGAYIESLRCAINTPAKIWSDIGVEVDGKWRQLNANILQIENEYYSSVRPKPILSGLDKPVNALQRSGIEYVELRSIDVNAYHPLGVDHTQLNFLEIFMLFCLLHESENITDQERMTIDQNIITVAHKGREPQLKLKTMDGDIALKDWGINLFEQMQPIAEMLDASSTDHKYTESLQYHLEMVNDASLTPSAIMLEEMRDRGEGFYSFANRMSQMHKRYFKLNPLSTERLNFFEQSVIDSHQKQKEIEAADTMSFSEFMKFYQDQ